MRAKVSLDLNNQCRELSDLRVASDEYFAYIAQSFTIEKKYLGVYIKKYKKCKKNTAGHGGARTRDFQISKSVQFKSLTLYRLSYAP